eukprot:Ihof_evm4s425 gene=Ihof_evmTU4s425
MIPAANNNAPMLGRSDTLKDYEHNAQYKAFAYSVLKCIKSSEAAREWADLISFLGRLYK